jgi:hypothetical protein
MPGIVVVLGPADVGRFFLRDLMVGLRERGRAATFPRADLPEPPPLAVGMPAGNLRLSQQRAGAVLRGPVARGSRCVEMPGHHRQVKS